MTWHSVAPVGTTIFGRRISSCAACGENLIPTSNFHFNKIIKYLHMIVRRRAGGYVTKNKSHWDVTLCDACVYGFLFKMMWLAACRQRCARRCNVSLSINTQRHNSEFEFFALSFRPKDGGDLVRQLQRAARSMRSMQKQWSDWCKCDTECKWLQIKSRLSVEMRCECASRRRARPVTAICNAYAFRRMANSIGLFCGFMRRNGKNRKRIYRRPQQ